MERHRPLHNLEKDSLERGTLVEVVVLEQVKALEVSAVLEAQGQGMTLLGVDSLRHGMQEEDR